MDVMYIINKTRLSESGRRVTIVRQPDPSGVVLVDNGECVHSTRVENLSAEPIIIEQAKPIERKKPESKKPLTQAEKLQLEYLNSIR